MKATWMLLALGLIYVVASPALAADMKVDLNIPGVTVTGLQGKAQAVALWVEDGRSDPGIGVTLQNDNIVPARDIAATVMASFTSALRAAGFRLVPYRADAPVAILVRIRSLSYTSEKNILTSTARLSCGMVATLSRGGAMVKERTLGTTGEYTLTWRPNRKKISELLSSTLGDTVQAVLQDADTVAFLNAGPQQ